MNDPLANLPGYVLRRASSAALAGLNRRLSALTLRHVDASLLMLLNGQPGITQSEAGRILDIQRANMVPIVSRLEARVLIDRQLVDGRSQGLYLSADGEVLHTQVLTVIDAYEQTLMEGVPAPLRKQAMAVLHAFWQSAEAAIGTD